MKKKKITHTAILWSTTTTDVQSRIADLKKWRYERGNGSVTNNVSLVQYENMKPCLTEEDEEKLHADISTIVELTDAISDSYKENTLSWIDLHNELLKTQCTEADWVIINSEIQSIIKERQFLNELFANGNGVAGSSWYRKKGWDKLGAALKGRMGVITCPFVIKGATEGVVIVSWRVKFLDMGRMFMTPFYGKNIYANIPENLGDLTNIEELSFCFNFLMGEIPDSICNLKKLRVLKLEANQLSGTLPVGFGKAMVSLKELYIDHNRLEGEISELLDLENIQVIHLHENKFYGELSDAFAEKVKLKEFYFYRNYLEYSDRIADKCDGETWKGRTEKEVPMRVTKLPK